jgi:peroxin-6
VSLEELAAACPVTLTGADLYALCADAWMLALKRRVEEAEEEGLDLSAVGEEEGGEGQGAEGRVVVVRDRDLSQALHSLTPSLGPGELEQYRQLKEHYEARGK